MMAILSLKNRKIIVSGALLILALFIFVSFSYAQGVLFDLENLKNQNPTLTLTKAYDNINVQSAWKEVLESGVPIGQKIVTIGVFDTGIDILHREFANVLIDTDEIKDFDSKGHGTQVIGIIGADNKSPLLIDDSEMNGIVSGITDRYGIVSRHVLKQPFFAVKRFNTIEKIGRALEQKDITIVNLSFTGTRCAVIFPKKCVLESDFIVDKLAFNEIFKKASSTLFVVGAGNEGVDAVNAYPASLGFLNNVITVGATNPDTDERALFVSPEESNFGNAVSIAAPGLSVYAPARLGKGNFPTSGPDANNYKTNFTGTSASAPMVTGVAGLLKAIDSTLTPLQIKNILINTADPIDTRTQEERDNNEEGKLLGQGCSPSQEVPNPTGCRLNALAAVQAVLAPPTQCSDGADNDGDGLIDFPDDPGCEDAQDDDEFNAPPGGPPITCPLPSTITSDATIPLSESPCVIQNNLTIPSGVTLTIDPGVIVKINSAGAGKRILVNGILNANGTEAEPIFFTSIGDDSVGGDTNGNGTTTPQHWLFIETSTGGEAHFTHSTIRFGGRDVTGEPLRPGIRVSGGILTLEDSRVTDNDEVNIQIFGGTATLTNTDIDTADRGIFQVGGTLTIDQSDIHNNRFSGLISFGGVLTVNNTDFQNNREALSVSPAVDFTHSGNTASNNDINGIVMSGSTIADTTWTKDLIPYVLSDPATSSVRVIAGTKLTIDPGVIVKFAKNTSSLTVFGEIEANGTLAEPIFFTSIKDDDVDGQDTGNDGVTNGAPAEWRRILLNPGSTATFSHSVIRFGGTNFSFLLQGGLVNLGGTLTFDDSHITQNFGTNLNHIGGVTTVTGSKIDFSNRGIWQTSGILTVSSSSISNNTQFGAFASGGLLMQAQNNWWGDSDGPFHPTLNASTTGNAVSDNVLFIPFLNADPVGSLP